MYEALSRGYIRIESVVERRAGRQADAAEILKVQKGCVSPYACINDTTGEVTMVLDSELASVPASSK